METTIKEILTTLKGAEKDIKDIMILLAETKEEHKEIMKTMDDFINLK